MERIAKTIARAGLCSRREAEKWIEAGRVHINGRLLATPAYNVGAQDFVTIDGKPLPEKQKVQLWRYHKPAGLLVSRKDPQERPTVFEALPENLRNYHSVGRLDINTEGLLLLTNDGDVQRHLELPSTGWVRRYRVRAFGRISEKELADLKNGITIDGIAYRGIDATLERKQGDNVWLAMGIREGKNREIKKVLLHMGLKVNRLIRISFGPFQLGHLPSGSV
ncbi:MAG: rRNA pseudouridine synthase, partial [Alphaproteobacteria bacterium]|nr:rRNA pseudouridine synthase [Alphaproteobacteria bacterium]